MMMNRRTSVLLGRLALIVALAVVVLTAAASAPADVTRSSSVLVASFASSTPSFAGPRFYGTSGFTSSLAMGDLNGDGKLDVAAANTDQYSPSVSVLLNRGNGSFRARVDYEAGGAPNGGPSSVAIRDLNGDDKSDLVTANISANTASVLLNRGDGRFRTKRDYETGNGSISVAIGDLNGDRWPDLATANREANSVSVLLNKGDGSFPAKVDYGTGRAPTSIAIGDVNGDGVWDLATANHQANSVSVLLNRGDGSFRAKLDYGTGREPSSIAIGDVNGDGKSELATANNRANTVSLLTNRGDGSFQVKRDYASGRLPGSLAMGDLNGDGNPELVTTNYHFTANSVSVLVNRGDGTFEAKRDYETGVGPLSVAIGDLNGDGRPDLAAAMSGERPQFHSGVSVLANATGLCGVPDLRRKTLPTAKRAMARAACRVGTIRRAYSPTLARGRVISQKPQSGAVLRIGGKVNLIVSRGRKR